MHGKAFAVLDIPYLHNTHPAALIFDALPNGMLNCDERDSEACIQFLSQPSNVFWIPLTWRNSPKSSDSSTMAGIERVDFDRVT